MSIRLPSLKTSVIVLAVLFVAYLLLGWLALPPLLQSQAERYIAENSGHRLTMDPPEFNPFTLALRLHNVRLAQPDDQPLLAFKELLVDFSGASLFRGAFVFDTIRLDDPQARLDLLPDGKLNWSALIGALRSRPEQSPPERSSQGLPRLVVHHLAIVGGGLEVSDRRAGQAVATRVEPLDLELAELSTLPDDQGQYRVTAQTGFGAHIDWQGQITLEPLAVTGRFEVTGISLPKLAQLIKLPLTAEPPEGTAALSAQYRLTDGGQAVDFGLDQIAVKLVGFKLRPLKAGHPLLAFDAIELKDGRFDLRQRRIDVGALTFSGGGLDVERRADGRVDLLDFFPAKSAPPPASSPPPAAWHFRIGRIALAGFAAAFHDHSVTPAAGFGWQGIAASVEGVSDNLAEALPVQLSGTATAGGQLTLAGKVVPGLPTADVQVSLGGLSLKPAQPYLAAQTTLAIADGKADTEGRLNYDDKGFAYSGKAAVRDLLLTEGPGKTRFLRWKSLHGDRLALTSHGLEIGRLDLTGLDTRLIINKDKTTNLASVVRSAPAAPAADAQKPAKEAAGWPVNVGRLRVANSQMEFADYSLALPFGTRIHKLRGDITGLSSRPGAAGRLLLDGQVDEYGIAHAAGRIDLFKPTDLTDVKVTFRNVEMARLTPYSATFAGRKIDSGKLSLDLEYKIDKRQLTGNNKIIMDRLTLGERVESPQAKDLPLDLAIAILQDADGRIDLGLPVSGSLDDPQFSYGQIVWKAIINVLTKIVTAPFRALGALFGGEKVDSVVFAPGQAQLAPPEREKLVNLAAALNKRPRLGLSIGGTWTEADRVALQDLAVRQAVAAKHGRKADEADAGPLATDQPKVQAALENLFADRFGGGELAALKEGFRQANPGALPQSAAEKMMARMSGLFRKQRTLDEAEVAALKGVDYYAELFRRLRNKEAIPPDRLQALAKARGDAALAELKSANAPMDRITGIGPVQVDVAGEDIPLRMELKATTPSPAGTPATPPAEAAPAPS